MDSRNPMPFRIWQGLALILASQSLVNGLNLNQKLQCRYKTISRMVPHSKQGLRNWTASPGKISLSRRSVNGMFETQRDMPMTHVRPSSLEATAFPIEGGESNTTEVGRAVVNTEDKPSFPLVLWRFTRPHTLIGSAIAIPAIHMLAAPNYKSIFTASMLISTVYAMIPSLLMNLYITGLNQITDVEIDKINKPYLPIAKGDLSPKTANILVTISLLVSLVLGMAHPLYGTTGLNFALWGSAILGTMYSLPPFRLKRFPFLAAFCIIAVRGAVINTGFYAHALSGAFQQSSTTVFSTIMSDFKCQMSSLFFGVFGIVIALMKDVPDVQGDALANIKTFSVRMGQKTIFHTMRRLVSLLFYSFGAGFLKGAWMAFQNQEKFISLCRAGIALFAFRFGIRAREEGKGVDSADSDEVFTYYMYLWKLFYASYFALPFAK